MKTISPRNEIKLHAALTYALDGNGCIIRHPGNNGAPLLRIPLKKSRSRYKPHVGKKQLAKMGARTSTPSS